MANDAVMDPAWTIGIFDAHCHPTDIMSAIDRIRDMKAGALTIMASRAQDQDLVEQAAETFPIPSDLKLISQNTGCVIPSFGWHPWFAHQIYDDRNTSAKVNAIEHYTAIFHPAPTEEDAAFLKSLPEPSPLSSYLRSSEEKLLKFPHALVGEVGLDRPFRIPYGPWCGPGDTVKKTGSHEEGEYTPGSREGRPLTPYRVKMEHQKMILKAQLELAAKLNRSVSIHSVQTHGVVFEVLQELWKGFEKPSKRSQRKKDAANIPEMRYQTESDEDEPKPFPPRICMHSYSGPVEALKQYLGATVPADIFFSFSELINFNPPTIRKASEVIRAVPDRNILIESDFHCAGDRMDELLGDVFTKVCEIKGWNPEEGARQLRSNWIRFVFGDRV